MGGGSSPGVLEAVEAADLVIDAGGVNFNEINTGTYSSQLSPEKIITIDVDHVRIGNRIFNPVQMGDLFDIEELSARAIWSFRKYPSPTSS